MTTYSNARVAATVAVMLDRPAISQGREPLPSRQPTPERRSEGAGAKRAAERLERQRAIWGVEKEGKA